MQKIKVWKLIPNKSNENMITPQKKMKIKKMWSLISIK